MLAFLDAVAKQGGEPDLGLLIAQNLSFESYSVWSDYVMSAPTLGGAMRRAKNSIGFHSQGDQVALCVGQTTASFCYRSASRGQPGYIHVAFGTIGVMLSLCRCYLSDGWVPLWIEVDLPRPSARNSAESSFRCPVLFDQPDLALVFMARELHTSRRADRQVAHATLEDVARARLEPETRQTLYGTISASILTQVLAGRVSVERTAQSLGFSTRKLQRELDMAGRSFREMVNEARLLRAQELLGDQTLSVAEIAASLGYSTSAHFARAFRRATGLAPMVFRTTLSHPYR